jgi:hypothetical protein
VHPAAFWTDSQVQLLKLLVPCAQSLLCERLARAPYYYAVIRSSLLFLLSTYVGHLCGMLSSPMLDYLLTEG